MVLRDSIFSHDEITQVEGRRLQKGMNFRPRKNGPSVFLMSRRSDALYEDALDEDGKVLIYQGHDISKVRSGPHPSAVDQPLLRLNGRPSDNARFIQLAEDAKRGGPAETIRVYEKIQTNIWSFAGSFKLVDWWKQSDGKREVFKFKLRLLEEEEPARPAFPTSKSRIIPSHVKVEVWRRDAGKCVECGATDSLHFDHILPFSKGGASVLVENVQILCSRHNLSKGARIR